MDADFYSLSWWWKAAAGPETLLSC